MPWFKVDDTLAFHAKTVAAGNAAMGLWVRAGSWSSQNLTDGFVPAHLIPSLGTQRQADQLVKAGLWSRMPDGYNFHEWAERQPSREQTLSKRSAAAERSRRAREVRRAQSEAAISENPQVSESRAREDGAKFARSSREVRYPRPDPTRPITTSGPNSAKRRVPLPPDFTPNTTNERIATERRVDLSRELAQFCDHHVAKGSTFADWHRALNTWLRNARPTNGANGTGAAPKRYIHAHDIESPPASLNPDNPEEYDAWYREQRKKAR